MDTRTSVIGSYDDIVIAIGKEIGNSQWNYYFSLIDMSDKNEDISVKIKISGIDKYNEVVDKCFEQGIYSINLSLMPKVRFALFLFVFCFFFWVVVVVV